MATMRLAKGLVWPLFFFSGAAALVYEVLWVRQLTLVFGNTIYATATVLAAYMGGLALGSWLLGRVADKSRRPLFLYGILEGAVGASALLFPILLSSFVPLLKWLYRSGHPITLDVFRFSAAFLLLLVPTAAMGGTLPALARFMARPERAGRTLGALYGLNTLGAVAGTILSGFWMLPQFGLFGTTVAAATVNALLAALGMGLGWGAFIEPELVLDESASKETLSSEAKLLLGAFLVSGALALALEVLWTRSLLLVFGSTVYSFSTMLAVFLLGLALGSVILGLFVDRIPGLLWALGLIEGGAGIVTLIAIGKMNTLPRLFLDGLIERGLDWHSYMASKVLISSGILLPVSLLFGMTFPVAARMAVTGARGLAGRVGLLYAFNTVGAIAGSLAAGFVLLPALGLRGSLVAASLAALALGAFLSLASKSAPRALRYATACALLLAGGVMAYRLPSWDKKLLSAGVYFRPADYMTPDHKASILNQVLGDERLVRYIEGMTETAAVVDMPVDRRFLVDGKVEATTHFVDMRLQRLMGHLPMLFAKSGERVVNIGLGCGITLGAAKVHPLKELTCVELEKKILVTARDFAVQNHHVLDDPKLKVVLNDGRNHLLLTNATYDVITSDPFEPLVGGAASLYTYNHFLNGRKRLAPGGIFCQYLPMYQLSPGDFQMILRSFCRVFPHTSLWYTGQDTIILGSTESHAITLAALKERMAFPAVKQSLEEIGIATPEQLLQTFVMDPGQLPSLRAGELNTDGNPHIEFSAPKSHLANTTPLNLEWCIENYHPEQLPLVNDGPEAKAAAEKARAVGLLSMKGSLARFDGRYDESLGYLREARALDPANAEVLYGLTASANMAATDLMNHGRLAEAKTLLDEALATGQQPMSTLANLAGCAFKSGDANGALGYIDRAMALAPLLPDLDLQKSLILQALGRNAEAAEWCERAISLNPEVGRAYLIQADMALNANDHGRALAGYEKAAALDPGSLEPGDWLTLGMLRLERLRYDAACAALERATRKDPSNVKAWYNLARARQLSGKTIAAQEALAKARAVNPSLVDSWAAQDPAWRR